jgi:hypothetical protein
LSTENVSLVKTGDESSSRLTLNEEAAEADGSASDSFCFLVGGSLIFAKKGLCRVADQDGAFWASERSKGKKRRFLCPPTFFLCPCLALLDFFLAT